METNEKRIALQTLLTTESKDFIAGVLQNLRKSSPTFYTAFINEAKKRFPNLNKHKTEGIKYYKDFIHEDNRRVFSQRSRNFPVKQSSTTGTFCSPKLNNFIPLDSLDFQPSFNRSFQMYMSHLEATEKDSQRDKEPKSQEENLKKKAKPQKIKSTSGVLTNPS